MSEQTEKVSPDQVVPQGLREKCSVCGKVEGDLCHRRLALDPRSKVKGHAFQQNDDYYTSARERAGCESPLLSAAFDSGWQAASITEQQKEAIARRVAKREMEGFAESFELEVQELLAIINEELNK